MLPYWLLLTVPICKPVHWAASEACQVTSLNLWFTFGVNLWVGMMASWGLVKIYEREDSFRNENSEAIKIAANPKNTTCRGEKRGFSDVYWRIRGRKRAGFRFFTRTPGSLLWNFGCPLACYAVTLNRICKPWILFATYMFEIIILALIIVMLYSWIEWGLCT